MPILSGLGKRLLLRQGRGDSPPDTEHAPSLARPGSFHQPYGKRFWGLASAYLYTLPSAGAAWALHSSALRMAVAPLAKPESDGRLQKGYGKDSLGGSNCKALLERDELQLGEPALFHEESLRWIHALECLSRWFGR